MNRIIAVVKKQVKDTLKNKMTLILFVMFPVIALILTEFVSKPNADLPDTYFVVFFATMFVGYTPVNNMASIISEEREQKSLRMLIMSNVKPFEYLIGVGAYVLLLCALCSFTFGLIAGYFGADLLRFVLIMSIGSLTSIFLGSAVGVFSKSQSAAHALAVPIALIAAFMPMIAMFNDRFSSIAKVFYTQQISLMVNDISLSNFTLDRFIIIAINMLIFLAVFIWAYSKADLKS
jgi:ABC-2 type transport system permease protein